MKRPVSLILAFILLIACAGCFWGYDEGRGGRGEHDRGGHGDQGHGGHEDRH